MPCEHLYEGGACVKCNEPYFVDMPDRKPRKSTVPADPAQPMAITVAEKKRERSVIHKANRILEPWQKEFARWEAEHPFARPVQRYAAIEKISGTKWTEKRLRTLRSSGLYREYRDILKQRTVRAAKFLLEPYTYESVQAMRWALETAVAAGDYKAVANLASPGIERASPRRDDLGRGGDVNINISFTQKQQSLLDNEKPIIEAEVISIEPARD